MFCPDCGKQVEEGKSFCRFCGANIDEARSHQQAQATQPMPVVTPPPPQAPAPPPPPPPVGGQAYPPPSPVGGQAYPPQYQQAAPGGAPRPPMRPARGGDPSPRWVKPFLIIMGSIIGLSLIGLIVVIALAAAGGDGGGGGTLPTVTAPVDPAVPNTDSTTATSLPITTATVPGYDPTATTAGGDYMTEYLAALDGLEGVLIYADNRIPELAEQINATAPRVPNEVQRELQQLYDDVDEALQELGAIDPPVEYQSADDLIFNAADEMLYRIDQTMQGVDAMWAENTVSAGNPYFNEGRKARDAFRDMFRQYQAARP